MIGKPGYAYKRSDTCSARKGNLRLQDVDADGTVFHVEDHELSSGICSNLAKAWREELCCHNSIGRGTGF